MKKTLCALLCLFSLGAAAADAPVQVLVLGTYHMGNPGLDLHNAKADDVLTKKRQRELGAVVDALARFKPTRVAVEWRADDQPGHTLPAYRDFLAGKRSQSRNEIDQLGFRLVQRMQLSDAFGIDAAGDFPFEAVQAFAAAHGQAGQLQAGMDFVGAKMKAFEAKQSAQTVGQLLRAMNVPEQIAADHGWYVDLLRYGTAGDQPGARLVAAWSARNIEICARLMQVAKPGDRIVVLYGAGHSHLLRQCVRQLPGWALVEANDYLPK